MDFLIPRLFPKRTEYPLKHWLGIIAVGTICATALLVVLLMAAYGLFTVENSLKAVLGLFIGFVVMTLVGTFFGVTSWSHFVNKRLIEIKEGHVVIITQTSGEKMMLTGTRFFASSTEKYRQIDIRPRVMPMNFEARTRDNLKVKVSMALEWQPVFAHIIDIDTDSITQENRVQDWVSVRVREFVKDNPLDNLISSPWATQRAFNKQTTSYNASPETIEETFFKPLRINALEIKPPEEFDTLFKQRKLIDLKTKLLDAEAQLKRAEFKMEETLAESARLSEFHGHLLKNKARANEIKTIDRIINEANPRTLEHIEHMEQAKSKS